METAIGGWSLEETTNINVDAYDGKLCAQMTLPESFLSSVESVLRQNLNVSAALHRPTLAFFYRFDPGKADDTSFIVSLTSSVSVTTSDAPTETVLISTTRATPDWTYATVDLSDWSGKNVDLTFRLAGQAGDAVSKVLLDRISLGSWKTPVPAAISPFHVDESGPLTVTVTISGQNFIDPPTVFLGKHQLSDVVHQSSALISATLTTGMAPDIYDLRVQNPGGYTSTRLSAFHVGKQVYLPIMQVD